MSGSTSNEEQLSATRARQLSVSELTAEALNMKYNVVTTEKKSIHSKRILPGAWGNNPYYLDRSERVSPLDKKMPSQGSNIAPVTEQCIIPQLGRKLAESKEPCSFQVSSDADKKKSVHTPSKTRQQPSPFHVRVPSTYSEDGDDELDDNSSSLDADADEDINENLKKDDREVKNIQAGRSKMSDSIEDFNRNRSTSNFSCQMNILKNHMENFQSSISDSQIKKTKSHNKTHRLSTRRNLNGVDSSEIEPKFTSTSGEQSYDSGTSDGYSDNYLGQVETTGKQKFMKVIVPECGDLHKMSISNDTFTGAPPLVTTHNAEPSDSRKNSDENGKLFLLSQTVLNTGNNLVDSAPEVQCPDCFLATDCGSTDGESVQSGTVIDLSDAEGTDGSVGLIDEQQYQRNIADSKSHAQLHNSVKINGSRTATTEIILRNAQRKLQKKIMQSNNTNAQIKLAEVHSELESSSELGDVMCKSGVGLESSNKRSYRNTLNKAADSSIITRSHSKHGHRSIPMVTIDYENEEDLKELKPHCLRNKINNMEVKTSELPVNNIQPHSVLAVYKSSREENYYDVARRPTGGTLLRKYADIPEENSEQQDTHTLFNTTRQLEFTPQSPEESNSISIFQPMKQPKLLPVDDSNYKPQTFCLQEYEPVRIKKTRKKISSAPKKNSKFFFDRTKATSVPELFWSRPMVWTQNQRNRPGKNNRSIADKEKPSSVMTHSLGTRISSAPSRSLKKERTVYGSVAEEIQAIQTKMARLGANDGVKALEKALFSTSGKKIHSHTASYLPSDPSYGLIPHYKHWLPEEYTLLQSIKKKLDEDARYKHLRSLRTAKQMNKLTIGNVENIIRKA